MLLLLIAALATQADTVGAVSFRVQPEQSVFAVVTHRAGMAARMAHNHLIVAADFGASLDFNPGDPGRTRFEFTTAASELRVDEQADREAWSPRLAELGIEDDLGSPDEGDRASIRKAMLSEKQLNLARFPEIRLRLLSVQEGEGPTPGSPFPWVADVELTVRDRTVRRAVSVAWAFDGTVLAIEGHGRFTFEEFGIKPYSAVLGMVKNQNEFDIYVNMKAVR